MDISTFGHAKMSAATKRHTAMVFPKRRGVEILQQKMDESKAHCVWYAHTHRLLWTGDLAKTPSFCSETCHQIFTFSRFWQCVHTLMVQTRRWCKTKIWKHDKLLPNSQNLLVNALPGVHFQEPRVRSLEESWGIGFEKHPNNRVQERLLCVSIYT